MDDVIEGSEKLRRAKMVVTQPRIAAEGVARRASFKLQDKAADEFLDIFRLSVRADPNLKKQLMEIYPEIRKTADNWDDFAAKLWGTDRDAAKLFMTKRGRAQKAVGDAIIKTVDVAEEIYPKNAPVGGGTFEGEAIKTTALGVVASREKARQLTDKAYREKREDFWSKGIFK